MVFMAWRGLQKCRAEGAFGILMSMYDGAWYRLVEEGGSIVEVSHHDAPSTGQKKERTFTESEVRAMLMRVDKAGRKPFSAEQVKLLRAEGFEVETDVPFSDPA